MLGLAFLLLAAVDMGLDRQAFRAYQQREWAEAVRLYNAYHAKAAGTPSTWDNLGVALASLGRIRQAEAALRRALQLDPRHRWAYNHLGFVLKEQGRLKEAAAMFEQQIRISPQDPYAYRNLASALAEEDRLSEAEKVAEEHERLTYERGAVYIDIACVLNGKRRPEEAKRYLNRAREAGAERSLVAQETAHYYLTLGDLPRAEEQYRLLSTYRPADPLPQLRLGTIYLQMGEFEKAAAAFGRVIEVDDRDQVQIQVSPNQWRRTTLADLRARPDAGPLGDLPVDLARAAMLVRASKRRGTACEELAAAEGSEAIRAWCR